MSTMLGPTPPKQAYGTATSAGLPKWGDLVAMFQASGLKSKLINTVLFLALFRLGAQIPIWGVNAEAIQRVAGNQLLGFLDMFSGGALTSVSVLALGIGPYITASIIMQLLAAAIPRLEEMQKEEGEAGRRKLSQITRYVTLGLALFQGALVMRLVASVPGALLPGVSGAVFFPIAVLALAAGALLSLWISEMITERGIGNGASLLILAGIITRIPFYISTTGELVYGSPEKSFGLVALLAIYVAIIGLIIILQEATRKVTIVTTRRQVGQRVYAPQQSFIPFKINPAGVMPIIFAFAVLAVPSTIVGALQPMVLKNAATWGMWGDVATNALRWYSVYLTPGRPAYIAVEFLLIVFFTFFYASIIPSMQPKEISNQLKKYGSAVPGVKPGRPTADLLDKILSRTMLIGAVALATITLVASSATTMTGITTLQGLGSTSLIIMVGVALDTMNQIRVHLLSRQYQGFLKK